MITREINLKKIKTWWLGGILKRLNWISLIKIKKKKKLLWQFNTGKNMNNKYYKIQTAKSYDSFIIHSTGEICNRNLACTNMWA